MSKGRCCGVLGSSYKCLGVLKQCLRVAIPVSYDLDECLRVIILVS